MATIKAYTSSEDIQEHWITNIAPNYIDLENTNNYRIGIFGYINEVMGNTTADAFHAINIARREFYPITAQNIQSLYKMAATQQIPLPLTTAATAKAFLLIPQKDIIDNSTYSDGVYKCVIDNTLKIQTDTIPFMLDYPIVILSKKKAGEWTHTIHYDTSVVNELNTSSNKYIMNKTIFEDGVKYVLLSVGIRQLELTTISELITKDNAVDTVTINIPFEGHLANFEVFYIEEPEISTGIQLKKVLDGGGTYKTPFCQYKMIDDNLIQISFPKNLYFNPRLNSEVRLQIYTSLGKDGEFDTFSGSLTCEAQSEKYPYNESMTITGVINGKCHGGIAKETNDEFRSTVMKAYTTNNTITTTNDLQLYFNRISNSLNNKVLFRKKRDDAAVRLYGAYCLLKDLQDNVVPTNTIDINLVIEDFDVYYESAKRAILKPGCLFEYLPDSGEIISYNTTKVTDLTLASDLDIYDDNSRFIFTNPFLIAVTLDPNIVGMYYNSLNMIKAVTYSYVNDATMTQFIGNNLKIDRNSILGENFYKFSLNISPSTPLDMSTIVSVPIETDVDYYIRAKKSGMVISKQYETDHIVYKVKYNDGTTENICASSYSVLNESDNSYTYVTGYNVSFEVFDLFIENDILGTKKVTDLGRIRTALDFTGILYSGNAYIPMYIDSYDEAANGFTVVGYIATSDIMTLESTLLIEHGIYNTDGTENANVSIPMKDLQLEVSVFYKNDDINLAHKYSSFNYYKNYTLTNSYAEDSNDLLALVQQVDFIRTDVVYTENELNTISMTLKEVPVAKANWLKVAKNFKYLTETIYSNYEDLYQTYFLLENDYGIDMKFFNTYGKSRFYKVGIQNNVSILKHINCSFRFGVYLKSLTSKDIFIDSFRRYVKDYIEKINNVENDGTSIYILNMITDIKNNFPEIGYMEYYGFNNYAHDAQKIEPMDNSEISRELITNYIPEFINVYSYIYNGVEVPKIEVTFLT